jgi:hypothetical protein
VLCQLSYIHHGPAFLPAEKECTGSGRVLAHPFAARSYVRAGGSTWRAAISLAVSESGPGCGTKTASR